MPNFGLAAENKKEKLPEAVTPEAERLAVVFDFDGDGCYPSPAVFSDGTVNPGLRTSGALEGQCRGTDQLANSNTYYRTLSLAKDGVTYAVHMYSLYFNKDQILPAGGMGHRHDWEFALVWTRNEELTHASCSAHGGLTTLPKAELNLDRGQENHVKVVYHKDDRNWGTHAFRFAMPNEVTENHKEQWLTPTLVNWETMASNVGNEELRKIFNETNWGHALCSFNDREFAKAFENPPQGYPAKDEWRRALGDLSPGQMARHVVGSEFDGAGIDQKVQAGVLGLKQESRKLAAAIFTPLKQAYGVPFPNSFPSQTSIKKGKYRYYIIPLRYIKGQSTRVTLNFEEDWQGSEKLFRMYVFNVPHSFQERAKFKLSEDKSLADKTYHTGLKHGMPIGLIGGHGRLYFGQDNFKPEDIGAFEDNDPFLLLVQDGLSYHDALKDAGTIKTADELKRREK